jgi:hypothetical protein
MALSKKQLLLFITLLLRSRRKRRIKYLKQFWVRPISQTRAQLSEIFTLVKTVKELQEATTIIPECYQTNLPNFLHNLAKPLV